MYYGTIEEMMENMNPSERKATENSIRVANDFISAHVGRGIEISAIGAYEEDGDMNVHFSLFSEKGFTGEDTDDITAAMINEGWFQDIYATVDNDEEEGKVLTVYAIFGGKAV